MDVSSAKASTATRTTEYQVVKKYGAMEGANQTLGRLAEQLAKMATGANDASL